MAPQGQNGALKEKVSPMEVAAGVESLYADELKPYGRILRKRLAEQAQARGRGNIEINVKELRATCEACAFLSVRDVEGADWAALLPGRAPAFVDVYSPQDIYPDELWQEAAKYFYNLDSTNMVLPGGRYACAQVLMQRRLPFLAGRSLGQVCHIVQLAISQKKLLGYLNGTVVPYSHSQSMVKEQSAECQRPCTGAARHKSTVATWDTMRSCLQQLMDNMGPGEHSLPLSNIKRLFRAQFHIELSETALGYAKLSECLQDSRLHDLCELKLKGHGYGIVPIKKMATARARISLSDSLGMEPKVEAKMPPPPPHVADISSFSMEREFSHQRAVQRLSMDVSLDDIRSPEPKAWSRHSIFAATPLSSKAAPCRSTPSMATPTRMTFAPTPSPMHPSSICQQLWAESTGVAVPCPLTRAAGSRCALALETVADSPAPSPRAPFSPAAYVAPTPSPSKYRPLPRLLGRSRQPSFAAESIKETKEVFVAPSSPPAKATISVAAMLASPGPSSGLAVSANAEPMMVHTPQRKAFQESKPWGFTPRTPGTFGFSVHNTFLHAALPLPTPVRIGARYRARSSDLF